MGLSIFHLVPAALGLSASFRDFRDRVNQGLGVSLLKTPFGFSATADEVLRGIDLTGKRIVVTGGASGVGTETARALAAVGAEVTLAVRRVEKGEEVAAEIRRATGNKTAFARPLDLADQKSVRAFAADWRGPLHVLINNAGVMAVPALERTPQGWELQFAANFMGHFHLALGLHQALATAEGARIVSVSSSAHRLSPVIFDDLHFNFMPYVPIVAYGQSKTACILLAVEATRRWANDGIVANSLHPGAIPTDLQRHTGGIKTPPEFRKTIPQGEATSVLLAASPLLEKIGGRYFEDCHEAPTIARRPTDLSSGGVAPYAIDPGNAERLWDVGLRLLGRG
jgi:NAD(P)-dependent dehydrogenase (short-subunit alcohol dehydrogenase family)